MTLSLYCNEQQCMYFFLEMGSNYHILGTFLYTRFEIIVLNCTFENEFSQTLHKAYYHNIAVLTLKYNLIF